MAIILTGYRLDQYTNIHIQKKVAESLHKDTHIVWAQVEVNLETGKIGYPSDNNYHEASLRSLSIFMYTC